MAYEGAAVGRDWVDSLGVPKRNGMKMNVYGEIGASEEQSTIYGMAISHGHERLASGQLALVEDIRGLESISPIPHSEDFHGIDFQHAAREWQPDATIFRSNIPWSPLLSQGMMEGQWTLNPPTKSCDQPWPFQNWPGSSFESAPSHFDGEDSGYAASSAEVSDQPTHSNPSNVPSHQRGQQFLFTPSNKLIHPLARDMSRTSSPQQEKRLYCRELGCRSEFKGTYAQGNLARHRRLKHGGQEVREYICEELGCSKSYKRQDARVKHYRKYHTHLASVPVLPRKKIRSMSSYNGRSINPLT